jgi:hypothetical protein
MAEITKKAVKILYEKLGIVNAHKKVEPTCEQGYNIKLNCVMSLGVIGKADHPISGFPAT